MAISSFGQGTDGELYNGFKTFRLEGRIYRITGMSSN